MKKNMMELLKSAYDGIFGENKEDLSSLFCSEMIAAAFQKIGLLAKKLPSNEYTPKDFSTENNLTLEKGYRLGKEIPITGLE